MGEIRQELEVRATAPVINSENATIGNILESRTVTALPLNGRTLDRLIRISAGVTTDSASNPRVAGSAYLQSKKGGLRRAFACSDAATPAERTELSNCWQAEARTVRETGTWFLALAEIVEDTDTDDSLSDTARLYALVGMGIADAVRSSWRDAGVRLRHRHVRRRGRGGD